MKTKPKFKKGDEVIIDNLWGENNTKVIGTIVDSVHYASVEIRVTFIQGEHSSYSNLYEHEDRIRILTPLEKVML